MKHVIKLMMLALLVTGFTACSKDKTETPAPDQPLFDGYWVGKYSEATPTPDQYFRLNILDGGFLSSTAANGDILGMGEWDLAGNEFVGFYQLSNNLSVTIRLKATYDPASGKLSGTWGEGGSNSNGGTFYLFDETKL